VFNLIVGAVDGVLATDRMLEVVDDDFKEFLRPNGIPDALRLAELPTLLMPEVGDSTSRQIARVGTVVSLNKHGRNYKFRFVPNAAVPAIPTNRIEAAAHALNITDWDLSRTRWSVKRGDLYEALLQQKLVGAAAPTAFTLPDAGPEPGRIATMMPFSSDFRPVWEAIKEVAAEGDWTCHRADNIWEDSVLINDVVSLIARATVVICDLTNRNANVFYETGIAHTLGREVILITQSQHDVPFDLTHHRYIKYLPNGEGLIALKDSLTKRLDTIMSR